MSEEKGLKFNEEKDLHLEDIRGGGQDHGLNVEAVLAENGPDAHDDAEIKRIVRKIDVRLLPVLASLYAFALIDRVNLANARIAGMDVDLGLSVGDRYTIVAMVFFVPYVFFQFPSNIILRKVGAGIWLPGLALAWGVLTLGMGFLNRWTELLACRVLLGLLEAGFFPGCIFLLSCWYVRFEVQKRFAGFYLLAVLASGFANILSYGLSQMDGLGGLEGWRWIFIIQGLITIALSVFGFLLIVGFPDQATNPGFILRKPFLTIEESAVVLARIERDRGDAAVEELSSKVVWKHVKDWKLWEYGWFFLLNASVNYSFQFFLPIILKGDMGYDTGMSQILAFPPYVLAVPWIITTSWASDRYRQRGVVMIFNCIVCLLGVAMMGFAVNSPAARYAGIMLGVSGGNSNVPTILSYMHNNITGQTKRSVASALLVGGGAVGGIVASNIFRQQDAPRYTPAIIAIIATQVIHILHVVKNFYVLGKANREADKGRRVLEGKEGFRYTL